MASFGGAEAAAALRDPSQLRTEPDLRRQLRSIIIADPHTGGPTTRRDYIEDVDAYVLTMLLFVDRERRRILLGVPNALDWRCHYGRRTNQHLFEVKEVIDSVIESGVVAREATSPAGVLLLTFRGVDEPAVRVKVAEVPLSGDQPVGTWCDFDAIPYDHMWADNRVWLPEYLETGARFQGHFVYEGLPHEGAVVAEHNHQAHLRHLGKGMEVEPKEQEASPEWLEVLDNLGLPYGGVMPKGPLARG